MVKRAFIEMLHLQKYVYQVSRDSIIHLSKAFTISIMSCLLGSVTSLPYESSCPSIGRLVGGPPVGQFVDWSVTISQQGGKINFHAHNLFHQGIELNSLTNSTNVFGSQQTYIYIYSSINKICPIVNKYIEMNICT